MQLKYHFASDNTAGIIPEAWAALANANQGFAASYGEDEWTEKASDLIRELFETDCDVYFVFTGTAANSLALAGICRPQHKIICHRHSHIATAECGGPAFFSGGAGLELLDGNAGKIHPRNIEQVLQQPFDFHYQLHKAVSITQSTEMGAVYTMDEIQAIGKVVHDNDLHFHMDGARFANAVAALGVTAKEITWQAGVDVLSFGATKLALPVGEAIVFFDKSLAVEFGHRCKQAGHVASKMRFLSAPWVGLLEDNAWLKHARHANRCATLLAAGLEQFAEAELLAPVDSNAVFVSLPVAVHRFMQEYGWIYHIVTGDSGARLMCSWDTTEAHINQFIADLRRAFSAAIPIDIKNEPPEDKAGDLYE